MDSKIPKAVRKFFKDLKPSKKDKSKKNTFVGKSAEALEKKEKSIDDLKEGSREIDVSTSIKKMKESNLPYLIQLKRKLAEAKEEDKKKVDQEKKTNTNSKNFWKHRNEMKKRYPQNYKHGYTGKNLDKYTEAIDDWASRLAKQNKERKAKEKQIKKGLGDEEKSFRRANNLPVTKKGEENFKKRFGETKSVDYFTYRVMSLAEGSRGHKRLLRVTSSKKVPNSEKMIRLGSNDIRKGVRAKEVSKTGKHFDKQGVAPVSNPAKRIHRGKEMVRWGKQAAERDAANENTMNNKDFMDYLVEKVMYLSELLSLNEAKADLALCNC